MQLATLIHESGSRFLAVVASLILVSSSSSSLLAQPFSPYADFQGMTLADLATLQVKLTFAGNQRRSRASIIITAIGNEPNIELFEPYERPGVRYNNDGWPPLTFTTTVLELDGLIDSIGLLPSVTDGDVDPGGYVVFALLNTSGGTTRCFEAVVNRTTGALLFDKLLNALQATPIGREMIWDFGCRCGMLPNDLPEDLAGRVSIYFSGLRRDPSEKSTFVGEVRVTNTSTSTIIPPLSLVIIEPGLVKLLQSHRTTCNIFPRRSEYVDLSIGPGLAPGASIDQVVRFTNPSLSKVAITFRAFGGAGTR